MKLPVFLVLLLLSGYVISQTCTGPSGFCGPHGGGCRINAGNGSCIINYGGGCNRIWNSSGRIGFAPWGSVPQYYGFLSHTPTLQMTRFPIICP